MKKLFALSVLFLAQAAMADTTVFTCVVPSNTNAVTLNVTLGVDSSIDFVTINLNEASGASVFYSQMDKGALDQQIAQGYANMLVLTDTTQQTDGVITDSGFLAVSKEADGSFTGFLAAKGNVYPLTCQH
jgi:hypothetical protein